MSEFMVQSEENQDINIHYNNLWVWKEKQKMFGSLISLSSNIKSNFNMIKLIFKMILKLISKNNNSDLVLW